MRACLVGTRLARARGLAGAARCATASSRASCCTSGVPASRTRRRRSSGTSSRSPGRRADEPRGPGELETTHDPRGDARALAELRAAGSTEALQRADPAFGARYDTASCEIGQLGGAADRARRERRARALRGRRVVERRRRSTGVARGRDLDRGADRPRSPRTPSCSTTSAAPSSRSTGCAGARDRCSIRASWRAFAANAAEISTERAIRASACSRRSPAGRGARARRAPALAAVFGDVADLKFPALHGHSSGVAALAREAARRLRLDDRTCSELEIAAHLHDLGRLAVTNAIWEKPGPLTSAEWEQVRMHAYHSERILATSSTLEALAPLVGMHHERLDGSGYHRGCRCAGPAPARAGARGGRRVPGDDAGPAAPRAAHGRACRRRARARRASGTAGRRLRRRGARGGGSGAAALA